MNRNTWLLTWPLKAGFRLFSKRIWISHIRDITERKQAEQTLQESEERLRHISELIPDFAYSCKKAPSGEFAIDWITGAPEQITGYTTDEIRAMTCWKFLVIDEDIPVFEKNVTGLSPGESVRCELRIRRKDGGIMWLSSYAKCVTDLKEPGYSRLYGGCRNITGRKQVEESLQESEARYRTILDGMQDAYVRADVKGYIIMASPSATRLFRYDSANDLIGLPAAVLYGHAPAAWELLVPLGAAALLLALGLRAYRRDESRLAKLVGG